MHGFEINYYVFFIFNYNNLNNIFLNNTVTLVFTIFYCEHKLIIKCIYNTCYICADIFDIILIYRN